MTIAVVYGPNEDKPSFFENLFQQIESFGNTSIVVGGDWNVPLNYDKDTYNYKHKNNLKSNKTIKNNMETLDLHDIWRIENEDKTCYTWRGPQNKMARLDYFVVSSDLQLFVKNSDIGLCYRSDHSPVSFIFSFIDQPRGRGIWKFNNSLLNSQDYVNIVKTTI